MCISRSRECYLIYVHGIKGAAAAEGRGERKVTADRCECAKHELQPDERALGLKILEQLYRASRCTSLIGWARDVYWTPQENIHALGLAIRHSVWARAP
jgi:hypothetical protein